MRKLAVALLAVALVPALAGCVRIPTSSSTEEPPAASAQPTPAEEVAEPESDRTEVPWADYEVTLQAQIDDLTAAGDCAGLQAAFDTADANNDATMSRTGHNNADLMTYIDESMRLAECY